MMSHVSLCFSTTQFAESEFRMPDQLVDYVFAKQFESPPRPDQLVVSARARQIEPALWPEHLFCCVSILQGGRVTRVSCIPCIESVGRLSLRSGQTACSD